MAIYILIFILCNLMTQNVNANINQTITCPKDHFEVNSDVTRVCFLCLMCPHGFGLSVPCGSVVSKERFQKINCKPCSKGTYSDSYSSESCKPCTTSCKSNEHVIRNCTRWSDTFCFTCKEGLYFSKERMSCLPCRRCCNDEKDVKIDECMTKGSDRHCSFESSKFCHYSYRNLTSNSNHSSSGSHPIKNSSILVKPSTTSRVDGGFSKHSKATILIAIIVFAIMLALIATLVIVIIMKSRREKMNKDNAMDLLVRNNDIEKGKARKQSTRCAGRFPNILSKTKPLSLKNSDENHQSDELDDFAIYDAIGCLYIFKNGAYIRHDKTSTIDGARNLVVEILHDDTNSNLDPDYMFISPIFKFYSQGTEFEKPVEICLPHSALIDSAAKNWDVKVICNDEREKHKAKWKEIDEINIEWNNIKFYTKTLLTYAVVGKPISSAKKRMQFALFSMQKMISDRLEMTLYLLDESKSYLDRVIKENKTKGWEMLGCLYAVFIDFCNPVDILVNIEELVEPWSLVHIKPDEVISSQLLRHSYFNIPMVKAVFRRSERRAKTFSCNFRMAIGGSEIIIPAVTFVPEELLCVFVDVHNEDPSLSERKTLLSEVPYDIMYQMCRKLDVPARERGQWRDVGRHFGVSEVDLQSCCREYASLDGSPSRALMEIIFSQKPKLSVGELIKFLAEHGRGDVVSVLSKVKD